MELQELINKWDEEIAMHRRVVEDPLMWTKEQRLKSSHQTQAICALLADVKKLSIHNVMPRSLTAENGAKDLLRGEFVECFNPDDSGNPYIVPITWDSIKNIYKRIVDHYVA